jgi:transposase
MSLRPRRLPEVPAETVRVARAAFPKGNMYLKMRDELGRLSDEAAFAALYPERGQPGVAPWRLALVLVMQFAEGLSDRQAADAVRGRIDWKYALGLELTDPGFEASVLREFRARLVAGGQEQHRRDAMLARFAELGLLKARGRQRTDSTRVLAAVRGRNRLEGVGETRRHALNRLAGIDPTWLAARRDPEWADRSGRRLDDARRPTAAGERRALAEPIGQDGVALLAAVDAATAPAGRRAAAAITTLRAVWAQQYQISDDGTVRWREGEDRPAAGAMITSPYDSDARSAAKRTTTWVGDTAHLTETGDPDRPHRITHVATTPGPTPDAALTDPIQAKGRLPAEHAVDAGDVDAGTLVSRQRRQVDLVGPAPVDHHWQARAGKGFDAGSLSLDGDERRATCPGGKTSTKGSATHRQRGHPIINIRFARDDCLACPHRACGTTARDGPRAITVRPQAEHLALQAARPRQTTPDFRAAYAARAGIEGTLSQARRVCGLRRARYIGLAKVHLEHLLTAAALNLHRVAAWWEGTPLALTRQARFVALLGATSPVPTQFCIRQRYQHLTRTLAGGKRERRSLGVKNMRRSRWRSSDNDPVPCGAAQVTDQSASALMGAVSIELRPRAAEVARRLVVARAIVSEPAGVAAAEPERLLRDRAGARTIERHGEPGRRATGLRAQADPPDPRRGLPPGVALRSRRRRSATHWVGFPSTIARGESA